MEAGLIHMNGRLYDPLLRRFLNADENIQEPYSTQNYNKYGYVMNNPLMFNDPTGEFWGMGELLVAVVIGAAAYSAGVLIFSPKLQSMCDFFPKMKHELKKVGGIRMFTAGAKTPKFVIMPNGDASLQGKLESTEVRVTQSPTADFVFEESYGLPTLEEVEKHIKDKKHQPEIASAKEMEKEGVNVGEFQIKLFQKIEELTLYSIEQNKQIKALQRDNDNLRKESEQIRTLLKRVEKLEQKSGNTK